VDRAEATSRLAYKNVVYMRKGRRQSMEQPLVAYLIQSNGEVSAMPTDELLVALDHMPQGSALDGQSVPSEKAVVSEFLHILKCAMQRSKPSVERWSPK
jgi:hypothetical protein